MRHSMIAILLCACASGISMKHPTAVEVDRAAEIEANYREFQEELTDGDYDKAKATVDQKKVDHRKVVEAVLTAMWRKMQTNRDIESVQKIAQKFELDRPTELVFAQSAFNYSLKNKHCELAADLAFWFHLEPSYADRAIHCALLAYGPKHPEDVARLACTRPGTKKLLNQLMDGWFGSFKQNSPDKRNYLLMGGIAALCTFRADQYVDLFNIGMEEKKFDFALDMLTTPAKKGIIIKDSQLLYRLLYQAGFDTPKSGLLGLANNGLLGQNKSSQTRLEELVFAKRMLEESNFKKTPEDYDRFIAAAVSQFQCGIAATVAIGQDLPDNVVEALYLNPGCLGGNLYQVSAALVPLKKADWFFDLSLQAHEYYFARNLFEKFDLGNSYFDRIIDAAILARDFDDILEFDPPSGEDKQNYQDRILERIMDLDEEWYVVRYAVAQPAYQENWYAWVDRAYLHALRRGAFQLAADIAEKNNTPEFMVWGINLAFESACKDGNLKEAEIIARRYLDKQALQRVAVLYYQKSLIEARKRKQQECKSSDTWCVEQVK